MTVPTRRQLLAALGGLSAAALPKTTSAMSKPNSDSEPQLESNELELLSLSLPSGRFLTLRAEAIVNDLETNPDASRFFPDRGSWSTAEGRHVIITARMSAGTFREDDGIGISTDQLLEYRGSVESHLESDTMLRTDALHGVWSADPDQDYSRFSFRLQDDSFVPRLAVEIEDTRVTAGLPIPSDDREVSH